VLIHKSHCLSFRKQKGGRWIALFSSKRNNWTKGTSKLAMWSITWTLKTQLCKATYNTATSHTGCTLLLLLIKFNHQPVCLCSNFLGTNLEIHVVCTRHRFCMHCMPFIWSCCQTSHFWNELTEWLKKLNLLPRDYAFTNITALGLRPDISQFAFLINYCFLLARYHIWLAKTKDGHPNLTHFTCTLKSQYEIEIKSGDTKKWKPLSGYMRT